MAFVISFYPQRNSINKVLFFKRNFLQLLFSIIFIFTTTTTNAQNGYTISGKITEVTSGKPLENATVHLK
ncbi:MAG: hypothetical protein ABIP35_00120, partial [Ginsengibacter sp.]